MHGQTQIKFTGLVYTVAAAWSDARGGMSVIKFWYFILMLQIKPGVMAKPNYNALRGRFSLKSCEQNNAAAAVESGVFCCTVWYKH
jgi:hypothetical protein